MYKTQLSYFTNIQNTDSNNSAHKGKTNPHTHTHTHARKHSSFNLPYCTNVHCTYRHTIDSRKFPSPPPSPNTHTHTHTHTGTYPLNWWYFCASFFFSESPEHWLEPAVLVFCTPFTPCPVLSQSFCLMHVTLKPLLPPACCTLSVWCPCENWECPALPTSRETTAPFDLQELDPFKPSQVTPEDAEGTGADGSEHDCPTATVCVFADKELWLWPSPDSGCGKSPLKEVFRWLM